MKMPHTMFARGKRVRVVLRDGTEFVDKFHSKASGSKAVTFMSGLTVPVDKVKSIVIYRNQAGRS